MRLYFKQRVFSWFDSYDVYDESGEVAYVVKGELAWGHKLQIYDSYNNNVAMLKQKVFTWFPTFEIYENNEIVGEISKEFSFMKPKFNVDYNGWHVEGDFFEWDYQIIDSKGGVIATISKEIFRFTDTYVLDISNSEYSLDVLLLVLAIDAEKDSRNNA